MIIKAILIILFVLVCFFFVGLPQEREDIIWGVNFSQKHSEKLGLDWKENYLALLDGLEIERIKVAAYWDLLEPERGNYYFEDLDWQIEEARKRGAKVLLAAGIKAPRWPECHLPSWAEGLSEEEQKGRMLSLLGAIAERYRDNPAVGPWQIENEPFFEFGNCPWQPDKEFLKKEISLVKSLDSLERPILVSESGEFSLWFKAARTGDMVGTTLYRVVWMEKLGIHFTHIFPPTYYSRRAKLVNWIFGKEVICVEMQAEPWGSVLLYDSPLEEQMRSMDFEQFKENISFAKRTNFEEIYLWGAEWWYWMKEKKGDSRFWNEVKRLTE